MTYDSARGVTVLFGGVAYPDELGDTWEWNGTTWALRSTSGPSPRYALAMAYDSNRGVTVLFGGYSDSVQRDTWEWDGKTWTLRSTPGPSPRDSNAMAYDSARGVAVLFSPAGDTWEWDGMTWTLKSFGPYPGFGYAVAYDSARGVTVLFGGDANRDTWELVNRPFDGDCDGDRDLGDVAVFQRCFSPGVPAEVECARFDRAGNEGVDLSDFKSLRGELTGPIAPPAP